MRVANTIGWILVGSFAVGIGWQRSTTPALAEPEAQFSEPALGGGGLIAMQLPGGPSGDRLVVVDSRQRAMAVYLISRDGGEIRLESVRPLQWDLQMTGYNCASPTPEEVRLGLERR
jgi:hypothetical protein